MSKGKKMEAFWKSVANIRQSQIKDAWTQTVSNDTDFPPQTWQFPEIGEKELQEIIQKLEAGDWRLKEPKSNNAPGTQIKKVDCDISMENCPPTEVVSSESEIASTVSNPGRSSDVMYMSFD